VREERIMPKQTRICPNGHVIPIEQALCPFCQQGSANPAGSNTRIDFEPSSAPEEAMPTLFEGRQIQEKRPLSGWLAVFEGALHGEAFPLYQGKNIIGSSSQCPIQVPEEGVQDQHLSIRFSKEKCYLTDFDSETGTFLNEKRTYRNELKDGDTIKIGKTVFRIKML
jgi:hypothetical protein